MKKLLIMAMVAVGMAACNSDKRELDGVIEKCPKGNMYGEHKWVFEQYTNDFQHCTECGLKRKRLEYSIQGKPLDCWAYMSPSTGKYDDEREHKPDGSVEKLIFLEK